MDVACASAKVKSEGKMMGSATLNDPNAKRFKAALLRLYGDQIERIVLFGSRARGEALRDADCDVAVFLTTLSNRWTERCRLADLRVDLIDETGAFFDIKPFHVTQYEDRTALMHEIRRDGLDVCSLNRPNSSNKRDASSPVPISC